MQYTDALIEARKFANEPLDNGKLTINQAMELRIVMRTILKAVDGRTASQSKADRYHDAIVPTPTSQAKKSRRERIGDMLLEGTKKNDDGTWTGVSITEIFQEERPNSVKDLFKAIRETYGYISYTVDSKGWHTFYHLAMTPAIFFKTFPDGKLPEGHRIYE